jgi:hypothetical protein
VETKNQRKYCDLAGNDRIVGMKRKPLQYEIANEGDEIQPLIASEYPQRHQPCCMHRDDQRIVPGSHLHAAADASLVGHRDIECV